MRGLSMRHYNSIIAGLQAGEPETMYLFWLPYRHTVHKLDAAKSLRSKTGRK